MSVTEKRKRKKQLIEESNTCSSCGQEPIWNGKPLVMQMDHINGKYDHSKENTRLLCPNCHSQTENFAGRAMKKPRIKQQCTNCGKDILDYKKRKFCSRQCSGKVNGTMITGNRQYKILWPSIIKLQKMVNKHGLRGTGYQLGVSDNAVRKHIIVHSRVV